MKKIKLCQPVYKLNMPEHILIKDVLLSLIDKTKSYKSKVDNISSLDWEDASDFKREWVAFFTFWNMQVNLLEDINCFSINLQDIWFQQYERNDEHGCTSRGNFTGLLS